MSVTAKAVAVVVLHYERLDFTTACYQSLVTQTHQPLKIYIVDNGSRSHSPDELNAVCPTAEILHLEQNLGFSGGINSGIRAALADPAMAWCWILNNDTICHPDTLRHMLAAGENNQKIGLVGSPLHESRSSGPPQTVPAGKNLLRPWYIPVTAKDGELPDFLFGASLLIRRELTEDIGLLDEGYFFFFEDADYSLQAGRAGWQMAVAEHAVIEHIGSGTIRNLSEMQARCYRAGHVRLLRKFSRWPLLFALPPFAARLVIDLCRRRWAAVRGSCRGWRAGWKSSV